MKTKVIASALILALIAGAVTVKMVFFPSIKDEYFAMNERNLKKVPFGLLIVRPTHFQKSFRNGIMSGSVEISGQQVGRTVGRDVTLQQLIAFAYGRNADRVVLPAVAPHTSFDFLVTVRGDPSEELRKAIQKKMGYVAETETRDEEILSLEIQDAGLPGLTVSDASSNQNVDFHDGKLHFTHFRLQDLTGDIERTFKQPVVDKTELTNFYDFSIVWDHQMQRRLNNETNAPAAVKGILGGWGLKLVPDNGQVEMLVVKKI